LAFLCLIEHLQFKGPKTDSVLVRRRTLGGAPPTVARWLLPTLAYG